MATSMLFEQLQATKKQVTDLSHKYRSTTGRIDAYTKNAHGPVCWCYDSKLIELSNTQTHIVSELHKKQNELKQIKKQMTAEKTKTRQQRIHSQKQHDHEIACDAMKRHIANLWHTAANDLHKRIRHHRDPSFCQNMIDDAVKQCKMWKEFADCDVSKYKQIHARINRDLPGEIAMWTAQMMV